MYSRSASKGYITVFVFLHLLKAILYRSRLMQSKVTSFRVSFCGSNCNFKVISFITLKKGLVVFDKLAFLENFNCLFELS